MLATGWTFVDTTESTIMMSVSYRLTADVLVLLGLIPYKLTLNLPYLIGLVYGRISSVGSGSSRETTPPSWRRMLLPIKEKHSVIPDVFALLCKVCVTQNSTMTNRLRDYQAINCSSILRSSSKFIPNFLLYSSMISAIRAGSTIL